MTPSPLDREAEEAIAWMVRLRAGAPDARLQARFDAWRDGDPARRRAWEHLQARLGAPYDTLRRLDRQLAHDLLAPPALGRRDVLRGIAGLGLAGGALWLGLRSAPGRAVFADLRSATGERRRVTLADGSQLDLNAGSAVDVAFEAGQRLLLLRRGELVVRVAADPSRPFVVRSAQGDVRALGTRFLVRQEADATHVAVLEHAVRARLPGGEALELHEGQSARLHAGAIERLAGDPRRAAAWLDGRLDVLDEPLEAVVDALRPYRRGLVRVAPQVRGLRVQGVFPLDDSDRALTALAETLPIRVERYGPWLTLIEPAG